MKNILDRKVTLVVDLEKVAKDFGYKLDVDAHEDVYHQGYSSKDIRKMGIMFPKELNEIEQIFPRQVANALEDAERDAYCDAIRKERLSALVNALEKIDLTDGGAEYVESDGNSINAKAGILSAKIDEPSGLITLEILNPEHLINSIVEGSGHSYPELSAFEPESNETLIKNLDKLKNYFSAYGESKPSGELSSQYSPSINDEYFHSLIKDNISQLDLAGVVECVWTLAESMPEKDIEKKAVTLAEIHTEFSKKELKSLILARLVEKSKKWDAI